MTSGHVHNQQTSAEISSTSDEQLCDTFYETAALHVHIVTLPQHALPKIPHAAVAAVATAATALYITARA
jgi:hypothetical protein